jgi:hypothetical protein
MAVICMYTKYCNTIQYNRSARWPRIAYVFSFYAIIDILAIAPFYIAQLVPAIDRYDNYLRYVHTKLKTIVLSWYNCVMRSKKNYKMCVYDTTMLVVLLSTPL